MAAQKKYPDELRAVKMVFEIRERDGRGHGEIARVARQLDVHPEALRSWLQQAEIDGGSRPGATTDDKHDYGIDRVLDRGNDRRMML
jgi:transposase